MGSKHACPLVWMKPCVCYTDILGKTVWNKGSQMILLTRSSEIQETLEGCLLTEGVLMILSVL
jgi:hypothetical protein